ncbi:MAG: hypothetical protein R2941_06960 [Desulfobacterales bacterium]
MSARFGVHFLRKTDNRFENRDIDTELLSYIEKQPAGEFFFANGKWFSGH